MVSQLQINPATIDADIAALDASLDALQDMARSLPAGVPLSLDKHTAFIDLEARVNRQFDRLSYALAAIEGDSL